MSGHSRFPFPEDLAFEAALTEGVLLRRVLAWWLDAVLIALIAGALWVVLVLFGVLTFGLGFPLLAALPAVPFLYHAGFPLTALSATPGQAMLGLALRRDDDLGPPTPAETVVFTLGLYLTLAAGAVWLLVALLTRRHRALHDLVSGLVVVRKRALTGAGAGWNIPGRFTRA